MIFIGGFFASSVSADDTLVRFKGGIGVHPVSNVAGAADADGNFPNVTRNIVRGVNPAGQLCGDRQAGRQGEDERGYQSQRKGPGLGWRQ
jgi:hypothetical protein